MIRFFKALKVLAIHSFWTVAGGVLLVGFILILTVTVEDVLLVLPDPGILYVVGRMIGAVLAVLLVLAASFVVGQIIRGLMYKLEQSRREKANKP